MGEVELAKTVLLPYLQRADELQKHDPLVAYYCRLYAMERGLKVPAKERSKTMNALLLSLMKQLEKDKKIVMLSPDDSLHVEGFALNVFSKADKQDRAGRADLNTAKTFYAASIFFEILNQFGEPQPEIEQKQKYAVWKAADIRKALSEGRTPEPGPPGGDAGFSLDDLNQDEFQVEQSTISTPAPAPAPPATPAPAAPPAVDHYNRLNNDSPPFEDHHVVHKTATEYPTSHYGPTAPEHPDVATRPENYYSPTIPMEHDRWKTNDYPHQPTTDYSNLSFQSSYPVQPLYPSGDGSSYYPSPPTDIRHYYNTGTSQPPTAPPSEPPVAQYPSAPVYENPLPRTASAPAASQEYDANYKPPPEKVSEAHKASRFAVSALAFDDVPTAISYLRRSLELLTSPSAT